MLRIVNEIRENRFRWFGQVMMRGDKEAIIVAMEIYVEGKREEKQRWIDRIENDTKKDGVSKLEGFGAKWRRRTKMADPKWSGKKGEKKKTRVT